MKASRSKRVTWFDLCFRRSVCINNVISGLEVRLVGETGQATIAETQGEDKWAPKNGGVKRRNQRERKLLIVRM